MPTPAASLSVELSPWSRRQEGQIEDGCFGSPPWKGAWHDAFREQQTPNLVNLTTVLLSAGPSPPHLREVPIDTAPTKRHLPRAAKPGHPPHNPQHPSFMAMSPCSPLPTFRPMASISLPAGKGRGEPPASPTGLRSAARQRWLKVHEVLSILQTPPWPLSTKPPKRPPSKWPKLKSRCR